MNSINSKNIIIATTGHLKILKKLREIRRTVRRNKREENSADLGGIKGIWEADGEHGAWLSALITTGGFRNSAVDNKNKQLGTKLDRGSSGIEGSLRTQGTVFERWVPAQWHVAEVSKRLPKAEQFHEHNSAKRRGSKQQKCSEGSRRK